MFQIFHYLTHGIFFFFFFIVLQVNIFSLHSCIKLTNVVLIITKVKVDNFKFKTDFLLTKLMLCNICDL